ncbi:hypothetical protein NOJ05_30935, partial [Neorhizobium galegae]|uniref:hypothetical protein n=1 Tax=Neorhizobium galegae TaxID=399 RepID=UPI002104FDEF
LRFPAIRHYFLLAPMGPTVTGCMAGGTRNRGSATLAAHSILTYIQWLTRICTVVAPGGRRQAA